MTHCASVLDTGNLIRLLHAFEAPSVYMKCTIAFAI